MNFSNVSLALVMLSTLAAGCGKDKGGDAASSAPKVTVSPAMTAFLSDFKGKSKDITEALKTHGAEGLDAKDMDMYDMTAPKVTATEKRGDKECYTFDAKAGMTTRTYETCWANGKIAEVADKGMR